MLQSCGAHQLRVDSKVRFCGHRYIVRPCTSSSAHRLLVGSPTSALRGRSIKPRSLARRREPMACLLAASTPDNTKAFGKLQNGSDIRGVATSGIEGESITLTAGAAYFIARAFVKYLSNKYGRSPDQLRVSVGRDPRISGPMVTSAIAAGVLSTEADFYDFGLASTPAMFYSTITPGHQYDGAIMTTASHLPFNRNGLKFFTKEGGLEKRDITAILELATDDSHSANVFLGDEVSDYGYVIQQALRTNPSAVHNVDFMSVYAAALRDIIRKGVGSKSEKVLEGFKIVVDAGNGSGGFFATKVLEPLGADTSGSLFLDPDGTFPNHSPNPEDKAAMEATAQAVLSAKADLGVVFDTDVDRSGVVDSSGRPINSNRMIALMSAIILAEHPGTCIVTDSVTSNGLTNFIQRLGGTHFRYKRGYKNVITKGVELNQQGIQTELMMETSGHGAVKENYFLDDGAYLAVKVIIEMARRRAANQGGIEDLLKPLNEPLEALEARMKITVSDFKPISEQVLQKFHDWVASGGASSAWSLEEVNHEGWRVAVDEGDGRKGWLLLRASLHDPLLVLNAESEIKGGVGISVNTVLPFFQSLGLPLDLSKLQAHTK